MEYTDHRYGHVSAVFVDVPELVDAEDLFAEVHRRGGLLFANHPLVTPLDSWFGHVLVRPDPDAWTGLVLSLSAPRVPTYPRRKPVLVSGRA